MKAQSVLEYSLLVAISIVALVVANNFLRRLTSNNGALQTHFEAGAERLRVVK